MVHKLVTGLSGNNNCLISHLRDDEDRLTEMITDLTGFLICVECGNLTALLTVALNFAGTSDDDGKQ